MIRQKADTSILGDQTYFPRSNLSHPIMISTPSNDWQGFITDISCEKSRTQLTDFLPPSFESCNISLKVSEYQTLPLLLKTVCQTQDNAQNQIGIKFLNITDDACQIIAEQAFGLNHLTVHKKWLNYG